MILFLDFDGVLHPAVNYDATQLLLRLPLLEAVLRRFTNVEVVVSSTWRETRSLRELQSLFSQDVAERIIGITPRWSDIQDEVSFGTYVRQAEIESWLRSSNQPWESWLALDDHPHLFRPFCPNLIVIDGAEGLTAADCESLLHRMTTL